jgi:hypothetical protein
VTLRTRLTAAFLVVVVVPLLVVLAVVSSTLPDQLAKAEQAGLRGSSQLVAELVRSRCDRAGAAAEVAARAASATTRADDPRLLDVVATWWRAGSPTVSASPARAGDRRHGRHGSGGAGAGLHLRIARRSPGAWCTSRHWYRSASPG